ncbi:invasion associated locus B family protein [Xanthobacteraceae bacterium Astr-EGSB]|nr:invasion associated locus B family protein [Xanthobacteraceae bacterium Astr-EGSB]
MIATAAVLVVAPAAHAQQAPAAQPKTAQSAKPQPAKPQAAKPRAAKPQAAKPQTAKPAAPAIGGVQPVLLGQFGDWGAYTASPGGRKVCFALAKPKTSQTNPPNRPRDPIYMFISSRPAEKVKDEVSVVIGYGFKPNTDASLEIGGAQYAMYTQADGAWIKNAAEEPRLVETMRKSNDLTVKGTSARGTGTIDVFSLKGLDQALNRVGQECK